MNTRPAVYLFVLRFIVSVFPSSGRVHKNVDIIYFVLQYYFKINPGKVQLGTSAYITFTKKRNA